jgi:raffinose/stachyose/melibiose transport system permease protein
VLTILSIRRSKVDKVLKDKKAYCVFILPALIVYAVMVIAPIFMTGYYSTLDWNGIGKPIMIGLKNFIQLFTNDSGFIQSVLNSLLLAVYSVIFQVPIALVLAIILARGIKGEKFYRVAYFVPVVISSVVIGQLWLKIYNPDYGMLNAILKSIGLSFLAKDWLGRTETALTASLIPVVWQFIGYHMLLLYTAVKSIPDDIYEAAKIDGASEIATALKITIPLIKPMIKVSLTFCIIGSLKFFDLIYILTKGGPIHASEVPGYLMYNTIFKLNDYGYGSAIAVFIVAECILFYFLIQKFFKTESITY